MKRISLFLAVLLVSVTSSVVFGQVLGGSQVLDGIYEKEHVPARKPVPYYHLREADVAWSKKIWRIMDLREKVNHPLYFPTMKEPIDDRMSLIQLLLYGVQYENLEVYDQMDDEFKVPITWTTIEEQFGAVNDTQYVQDPETGELSEQIIAGEIVASEVMQYMLKEIWYFDNQRSVMKVRTVGLCPIREYYRPEDIDQEDVQKKKVFWVYFPAIRSLLSNHEVFNPSNDAERRTFDDIFFKRRFATYIYKETNVYDNRRVGSYVLGLDNMLESEKIKNWLFMIEHDLWEY